MCGPGSVDAASVMGTRRRRGDCLLHGVPEAAGRLGRKRETGPGQSSAAELASFRAI